MVSIRREPPVDGGSRQAIELSSRGFAAALPFALVLPLARVRLGLTAALSLARVLPLAAVSLTTRLACNLGFFGLGRTRTCTQQQPTDSRCKQSRMNVHVAILPSS